MPLVFIFITMYDTTALLEMTERLHTKVSDKMETSTPLVYLYQQLYRINTKLYLPNRFCLSMLYFLLSDVTALIIMTKAK